MTIDQTLADRADRYNRYGDFASVANTTQALIDVLRCEPGWERMTADQRQAASMIFDKLARCVHGDPTYRDNWHDIVGYAKLVDDRMAADEAAKPETIADLAEAGWKVWTGGERPGTAETKFDLRMRNGQELFGVMTAKAPWQHGDIVAYREYKPAEPLWKHWNGACRKFRSDTAVDLKFRNGEVKLGVIAGEYAWRWEKGNEPWDIIAYRFSSYAPA